MKGKEELEKLKKMSWKKRAEYIRDYYKWPIAGCLFGLFLLIALGLSILGNAKETVLSCTWVNETEYLTDVSALEEDFGAWYGLNEKKQRLLFDNSTYIDLTGGDSYSIASQSRLSVMWRDGDLDLVIADEALCRVLAQNDWFFDLSEVLPESLSSALEPYYIKLEGPDGTSRPYGLDITASSINPRPDGASPNAHVLCIPNTGNRLEAVYQFLAYIFTIFISRG